MQPPRSRGEFSGASIQQTRDSHICAAHQRPVAAASAGAPTPTAAASVSSPTSSAWVESDSRSPVDAPAGRDGKASTDTLYDAVIVGGGMGGLTTATQMAAKGAKVLVLEKCGHASGYFRLQPSPHQHATTLVALNHRSHHFDCFSCSEAVLSKAQLVFLHAAIGSQVFRWTKAFTVAQFSTKRLSCWPDSTASWS